MHRQFSNKAVKTAVAAVLLGALSAAAQAASPMSADDNPSGAYIGGGWGKFNLNIRNLSDVGSGVSTIAESDDNAWKLFGGYRFNPYFALEAAYIDFGTPSDRFTATGSNGNYRVKLRGFAPYVVGTLPLGPVELFARAGYYFYDNDVRIDFDSPGPDIDSSHSRSDFIYGAGLGFTFFGRLHARAEYETVKIENANSSDALWLSAAWRF